MPLTGLPATRRRLHSPRTLRAGLAVPAAVVVLALAGCEKPTPLVTVYSGVTSLTDEALCWAETGAVQPTDCQTGAAELEEIDIRPNTTVAVDVDKELAEHGWVPALGGQALSVEALHTTHYTFELDDAQLRQQPDLQVFAVERIGGPVRGLWAFSVRREG